MCMCLFQLQNVLYLVNVKMNLIRNLKSSAFVWLLIVYTSGIQTHIYCMYCLHSVHFLNKVHK